MKTKDNATQILTVSQCCASPLLVRGGNECTKWMTCASCKNPADQMSYPFSTVGQMEAWLKKRKAYRGIAYTASPTWNETNKSCYRSNLQFFYLIACSVVAGVLIAIAAS